ncbi:Flp1 family type IVb pilin [Diplocloster agilis]|uniref:Putative Flagellin Flp1-like domain-containing protein n=1 Tax=Diplocloster agilis TaxID=2850323 RepID=A0A949K6N7_9FIRM|nr:Flp1 family type IVb pilin [Diplocloster agilis]MBU9736147.1 hypothetical protein [Diplocloster agilis]
MNLWKKWIDNQKGIGTVEIILILLVLLGLIFIFKDQLTSLVGDLFEKIVRQSSTV